jgi:hypothetical protein
MAPDDKGRTSIRLLSFKVPGLPDLALALALQEVLEVTELGSVTEVPFAPHFLMGLSEWRGSVVTVVDMADVLCKSTPPRPASPSGSRQLVARVIADGQADAIAWSILPGASIIAAPSQAPQANVLVPLLPEGVYAAVTLAGAPHVLLNLAGIAGHMMKS